MVDFVSNHKVAIGAATTVAAAGYAYYLLSGGSLPIAGDIINLPEYCFSNMGEYTWGENFQYLSHCVSDFIATRIDRQMLAKFDFTENFFNDLPKRHDIIADIKSVYGSLDDVTHIIKRRSSFNPWLFKGSALPLDGNVPDSFYAIATCTKTACKLLTGFIFSWY